MEKKPTPDEAFGAIKALVPCLAKAQRDAIASDERVYGNQCRTMADMLIEPSYGQTYICAASRAVGKDAVDVILESVAPSSQ